ncbi:MAG TPA: T9SS type A sorting domain-containing protein, partial [Candidatus Kapabacteria bacterium]|nr:T9SS type A sorting domain-containing protein [Candidatus Kapabacteria bacterium]
SFFDSLIEQHLVPGEELSGKEGYLLHVTPTQVFIAGADTSGLMHAISRFEELWLGGREYVAAHIVDYPDHPNRWVFSMHNLRGANAVNVLKKIADTMYRYHYNGLQQNDFKYSILEEQPDWYFKNADTIKEYTDLHQIEIIPGVAPIGYSEGLLWHDPNLAEGFPASAKYVMEADTGRLIPDPPVNIPNGGFENVSGSNFTGFGFYDNDNNATQPDKAIFHSGAQSARTIDPKLANPAGNARFSLPIDTKPNKYYYLSAWVRTENIDRGEIRLLAIGSEGAKSRVLTHTAFNVASTTDRTKNNGWVKLGTLFNTQEFSKMNIYCGIWSGNTGTIWWDDFKIEEAGLVNILRRDGTPLKIEKHGTGGPTYIEGVDFAPLHDTIMEMSAGQYTFHRSPVLRRTVQSAISNGDTLDVEYAHAFTTIHDVNGIGQNMICPSEAKTYDLVKEAVQRVDALHNAPHSYMIGHDEIRHMNWDHACTSRNLSAAEILGDNVTRITNDIRTITGSTRIYAWSDMFDSLHNAVNDYYAVRGDLRGVWDMIPKDITIINWNSGKRAESLDFFAKHGFAQMSAPYYDAGNTINMRQWSYAMKDVPNVKGMMYTTWIGDYSHLRPFSYYAWGAGPYIIHKPLDSAGFSMNGTRNISAVVLPDPFDPNGQITGVDIVYTFSDSTTIRSSLLASTGDEFYLPLISPIVSYKLVAYGFGGLVRESPTYRLRSTNTSSVISRAETPELLLYPNPAQTQLTVNRGTITRVLAMSGAEIANYKNAQSSIDVSTLAAGSYFVEIMTPSGVQTLKFVKQ